ncbi:hypothetical protein ABKA04_004929 [Annulohypoxylon sp. FPYF3050]
MPEYTKYVEECRAELLGALDEMRALVLGPTSFLFFNSMITPAWTGVFSVLYRFKVAQHVPAEGAISYTDLAESCGLVESDMRPILRAAMAMRIFEETPEGAVRHTAISKVLATPLCHDAIGFSTEEYSPAITKFSDALQQFPGSVKAGESALALANGGSGDTGLFSVFLSHPDRYQRFSNAMSWVTTVPETSVNHFVNNVPWANSTTQECPRLVVDVGGSLGDICAALLRRYPQIERAIVEDLPEVTKANASAFSSSEIAGRIEYQEYDFFTEQVIKDADVYIFRTVFHDWQDENAIKILQNQIPAMKQGTRILICDICMGVSQTLSLITVQAQCAHDLIVKMGLNSKERTREEWSELLSRADKRFNIESIISPPYSVYSIIEVVWKDT